MLLLLLLWLSAMALLVLFVFLGPDKWRIRWGSKAEGLWAQLGLELRGAGLRNWAAALRCSEELLACGLNSEVSHSVVQEP